MKEFFSTFFTSGNHQVIFEFSQILIHGFKERFIHNLQFFQINAQIFCIQEFIFFHLISTKMSFLSNLKFQKTVHHHIFTFESIIESQI